LKASELFEELSRLLKEGRRAALCTITAKRGYAPRGVGTKMLVDEEGRTRGTIGGSEMERIIIEEALEAMRTEKPRRVTFALGVEAREGAIPVRSECGGEVEVFIDVIKPEARLIIVGSGHIAKPLAEVAHTVDFEVIVVDDAPTATRKRFPYAEIRCGPFEEEIARLEVRPTDFVAIVHGEASYELTALRKMIKKRPAYIGLLGSRHKVERRKRKLREEGFGEEEVRRIRGPIGLEIGAETPGEIAISIVAELIKERRGA
jgi:xanthine dehydrogenase accessory factor